MCVCVCVGGGGGGGGRGSGPLLKNHKLLYVSIEIQVQNPLEGGPLLKALCEIR